MHRLVHRQRQKAPPEGAELLLQPLDRRCRGLIEIRVAERIQQLQVPLPQFEILRSNLGEGWIRAGIADSFRTRAKHLLPLRHRIFFSEEHLWDDALDHREMTEHPERVTTAIRCPE